ncbi:hypothetical protein O988_01054 [Pseudogymnoascus sp. VKM F-3808]|nr:hypothetical protein O988_01054 [Pseudogymnoascus sp. VKM F-3808]
MALLIMDWPIDQRELHQEVLWIAPSRFGQVRASGIAPAAVGHKFDLNVRESKVTECQPTSTLSTSWFSPIWISATVLLF